MLRLSTEDEHADIRSNVVRATAGPSRFAILESDGTALLTHDWLQAGWVVSHDSFQGTLTDDGTSIEGSDPGFEDEAGGDLRSATGSPLVDMGGDLRPEVLPRLVPALEYVADSDWRNRLFDGSMDIGAFEWGSPPPGDVDGDLHITPLDVDSWLLWRYFGTPPLADPDCDGSGEADAPDLALILESAWAAPR